MPRKFRLDCQPRGFTVTNLTYHDDIRVLTEEGAKAAGGEHGKEADGVSAASSFIVEAGGDDVLTGANATANRTATTVTVTVTGHSLSVIPGWRPTIVQTASLPVERLTAP